MRYFLCFDQFFSKLIFKLHMKPHSHNISLKILNNEPSKSQSNVIIKICSNLFILNTGIHFDNKSQIYLLSKPILTQLIQNCRLLLNFFFKIFEIFINCKGVQFLAYKYLIFKTNLRSNHMPKQVVKQNDQQIIDMHEIIIKVASNICSSNEAINMTMNNTVDSINHEELKKKQSKKKQHEEEHIDVGEYLRSAVYGGLDGIINILAVILSGIGSGVPPMQILAMGLSILIGDGIGMGLGDYLSAKAQKQFIKKEEERELWEIKNKLLCQKRQIVNIYVGRQYTKQQAQRLSQLYATNDQAFVNIMMLQQLGLTVDDSSPLIGGVVTTFAFLICGSLPLIPYFASREYDLNIYLIVSIVVGGVQMFSLGYAKAVLLGLNKTVSGLQSLILGTAAVSVGYGIGFAFH